MRSVFIILIVLVFTFVSCDRQVLPSDEHSKLDTESAGNDELERILATVPNDTIPIPGNRFSIAGDFDGDGKAETLTEGFLSRKTGRETNKFYDSIDYDQLVALAVAKDPVSILTCSDPGIDTFYVAHTVSGQLFGLLMLRNEGDLNQDGRDEISYVVDWADFSNINSCHIATYTEAGWKELYSFMVHEYSIPPLPEFMNESDREQYRDFAGFITKLPNSYMKIARYDVEDTGAITVRCPKRH